MEREIMKELVNIYALEVASEISKMVTQDCNGCRINHPSQRQHPCLYLEPDERIYLYSDAALEAVSTEKIVRTFLTETKLHMKGLEIIKYTPDEWLQRCAIYQRGCIRRKTFEHV